MTTQPTSGAQAPTPVFAAQSTTPTLCSNLGKTIAGLFGLNKPAPQQATSIVAEKVAEPAQAPADAPKGPEAPAEQPVDQSKGKEVMKRKAEEQAGPSEARLVRYNEAGKQIITLKQLEADEAPITVESKALELENGKQPILLTRPTEGQKGTATVLRNFLRSPEGADDFDKLIAFEGKGSMIINGMKLEVESLGSKEAKAKEKATVSVAHNVWTIKLYHEGKVYTIKAQEI